MKAHIANFLAFQLGWFACVVGAANGFPLLGAGVAAGVVALHLCRVERPDSELALIGCAVACGLFFDSLLVSSGWLRYPSGMWLPGVAPYWILAMWAMFATTLNASMRWLRDRLLLAVVLGGVFGPLSYQAGARLGGLEFLAEGRAMIVLAVGWAVAMPALLILSRRFDGVGTDGFADRTAPVIQGERS